MKQIFILKAASGEYEDYRERIVRAYATREQAETAKEKVARARTEQSFALGILFEKWGGWAARWPADWQDQIAIVREKHPLRGVEGEDDDSYPDSTTYSIEEVGFEDVPFYEAVAPIDSVLNKETK